MQREAEGNDAGARCGARRREADEPGVGRGENAPERVVEFGGHAHAGDFTVGAGDFGPHGIEIRRKLVQTAMEMAGALEQLRGEFRGDEGGGERGRERHSGQAPPERDAAVPGRPEGGRGGASTEATALTCPRRPACPAAIADLFAHHLRLSLRRDYSSRGRSASKPHRRNTHRCRKDAFPWIGVSLNSTGCGDATN